MFSLLVAALPTTIAVAQGVSAAKREREEASSEDLMRKFTLICRCRESPENARLEGGGVVLRDSKLYIAPPNTASSSHLLGHPFEGFFIAYPDPDRPQPAPLGLVSSISVDPPVLNWIYVENDTRELKYGNRTQSRAHTVGSWKGTPTGKLGLEGDGGEGACVREVGGEWGLVWLPKGEREKVGDVRVWLERVFTEEENKKEKENGDGERKETKFEGGTTTVETNQKMKE